VRCQALVCRCRRASVAAVDDPSHYMHHTVRRQRLPPASITGPPMLQYVVSAYRRRRRHTHSCYSTSTASLTTGVDNIPTHATVYRQCLPLAASTYCPPMLCTGPFLRGLPVACLSRHRLKICTMEHTNTTSYACRKWRRCTHNIQAQALSAMQAQDLLLWCTRLLLAL
jgi:hypothetical protein